MGSSRPWYAETRKVSLPWGHSRSQASCMPAKTDTAMPYAITGLQPSSTRKASASWGSRSEVPYPNTCLMHTEALSLMKASTSQMEGWLHSSVDTTFSMHTSREESARP